MSSRTETWVIATMLIGVFGGCGARSTRSAEFGDGQFESLVLAQTRGMGFCPRPDSFLVANITQRAGGACELDGARTSEGDPATDECVPDTDQFECLVAEPVPTTQLSAAQVALLEQRIAAVPTKQCDRDPNLACDPCVVTTIAVDGHEVSGDCCGELNADFERGFAALVAAIDQLRPAAE